MFHPIRGLLTWLMKRPKQINMSANYCIGDDKGQFHWDTFNCLVSRMCGKEFCPLKLFISRIGSHGQFCNSLFPIVLLETFRRIMSRHDANLFLLLHKVRFRLDREENLCGNRSPENRHPVNSVGIMRFNWPGEVTFPLKDAVNTISLCCSSCFLATAGFKG